MAWLESSLPLKTISSIFGVRVLLSIFVMVVVVGVLLLFSTLKLPVGNNVGESLLEEEEKNKITPAITAITAIEAAMAEPFFPTLYG